MLRIYIEPPPEKHLVDLIKVLSGLDEDPGSQDNSASGWCDLESPISADEYQMLSNIVRKIKGTTSVESFKLLPDFEGDFDGVNITESVKIKDLMADCQEVEAEMMDRLRASASSSGEQALDNNSEYGCLKKDEITAAMLDDILSRIQLRVDPRGDIYAYKPTIGAFEKLSKYAVQRMIRSVLGPSAETFMSRSRLADIEALLKSHPTLYQSDEDFKPPESIVNVLNGVLNLDTGELLPHSARYKFSTLLNGKYLKRPSEGRKFMKLVRFLCEDDPEKIKLLQWYLGYVLSNGSQCKKLLIIVGPPNCGKSVLLEIIRAIVGPERVANVQLHLLERRFVTGHLADKAANLVTEMSVEPITNITTLKLLTSEDAVSGEMKGKDRFSYTSRIKFLVASNHLPKLSGNGIEDAFYDRVILLQTKASVDISNRDPYLKESILSEERDFALTWCLRGLMELRRSGYVFDIPESSLEIQRTLKSAVSSEKEFVNNCCGFTENPEERVHSYKLMDLYALYCKNNCLDMRPKEALFEAVAKIGGERSKFRMPGEPKRVNPRNGFRNLVIVSDGAEDPLIQQ